MPQGLDNIGIAFSIHLSLCRIGSSDSFSSHLLGWLVGIARPDVPRRCTVYSLIMRLSLLAWW